MTQPLPAGGEASKEDVVMLENAVQEATTTPAVANLTPEEKQQSLEHLKKRVIHQVEYYFSDSNLPNDEFMKNTLKQYCGWIPIEVLLTFKRVKKLCSMMGMEASNTAHCTPVIADCLRGSKKLLQVSEDGLKVKRAIPFIDPAIVARRTVCIFGFPIKTHFNMDEQERFWGQFGGVQSLRRYVPEASKGKKCIIFVEFDSEEIAQQLIKNEKIDYNSIE